MSGHSKWATIRRKKEGIDAKRGSVFTKIGRELAVAVKEGGGNPDSNSRLRDVIAKAKANNMPNDNIQRSIKKAAGEVNTINYEEIVYEGYGAGGVAVIVEALTDNRNRTASEVRHIFDKCGGSLGSSGCVAWMFDKKGILVVEKTAKINADDLMMAALDAGADDISETEEVFEVMTDPASYSAVREELEKQGYSFLSTEVEMIPQNTVEVNAETREKIDRLLDMLEDNDDVQNVYNNAGE
jgi:YebC/PmpR family DNA-binding regulatory protein